MAASLVLAVMAVATALPASPLRAWMGRAWQHIATIFEDTQASERVPAYDMPAGSDPTAHPVPLREPAPEETGHTPAEAGIHIDASVVPVQILLHDLLPGTEIEVVLVDGQQAGVFASEESSFLSGPGQLVVMVRGASVRVDVPRGAQHVLVLADGETFLKKDGDSLSARGPIRQRDLGRVIFVMPGG